MVTGSMRLSVTLVAADFLQGVTLPADHVSGPAADGHHWMPSPVLSPDALGVVRILPGRVAREVPCQGALQAGLSRCARPADNK
jgi:hypothetical protein